MGSDPSGKLFHALGIAAPLELEGRHLVSRIVRTKDGSSVYDAWSYRLDACRDPIALRSQKSHVGAHRSKMRDIRGPYSRFNKKSGILWMLCEDMSSNEYVHDKVKVIYRQKQSETSDSDTPSGKWSPLPPFRV